LDNLFDVKDKVVVVTGGSRGIGEMIARAYVDNGAKVYISSRNRTDCDNTAESLSRNGICLSLPSDLSNNSGTAQLANELRKRESRVDVLINNAGITSNAPIDAFLESDWDEVVDINMKTLFFLTRGMLPLLREGGAVNDPARVINISSSVALRPPPRDSFAYSAAKGGALALTRHLAKRLAGENINVNAIAPGPFVTRMTSDALATQAEAVARSIPMKRLGTSEDIAGVALFLGSRASAYVTGAVIPCDGGSAEL
jgi:NAD(P)-dependent dehydrogenase (short-subunit alcohol dehydrogenase family)